MYATTVIYLNSKNVKNILNCKITIFYLFVGEKMFCNICGKCLLFECAWVQTVIFLHCYGKAMYNKGQGPFFGSKMGVWMFLLVNKFVLDMLVSIDISICLCLFKTNWFNSTSFHQLSLLPSISLHIYDHSADDLIALLGIFLRVQIGLI